MENEKILNSVTHDIKVYINLNQKQRMNIAIGIHYVYERDLFKGFYSDIFDYCSKVLDIHKRTAMFYLDVVEKYCDYTFISDENYLKNYSIKSYYIDYNFSQLKAMLSLSKDEIEGLGIDHSKSVHEIEKIIKDYKKNINKLVQIEEDEDVYADDETEDKKIFSFCDKDNNIHVFEENYINDSSDYEMIFRLNNECLLKGSKKKYNANTLLKMLRQYIETNTEDNYYYAVIRIPKNI